MKLFFEVGEWKVLGRNVESRKTAVKSGGRGLYR